jgi:hypothetical protein
MRKTSEEIIQQALTGLRDARPREGMDQRLLTSLQQHNTASAPFRSRVIRLPWRWQFATIIPVAAALVVIITHHTLRNNITTPATPLVLQQPLSSNVIAPHPLHEPVCAGDESGCATLPAPGISSLRKATKVTSTSHTSQPADILASDQQALDDTRAPSYPAPPLPLTEQERLLLRATRKGEPIELAELEPLREPARRADAKAHEETGFQQYARLLLAPLVLSEHLHPTSASQSSDAPQPSPAPEESAQPDN